MTAYLPTARTTPTRVRDRARYDTATVHGVLDEAYVCHLGFVAGDEPRVLPTLHARVGERLYLHGSTGSRPMLGARDEGLRVCVTVTIIDGLVYGRSQFHHSANYRSVVVHGLARQVTDEAEKRVAFDALVDKVGAGRSLDSRPPTPRELAQTAVLALDLVEVSAKVRTGGVVDEPEDYGLPHWAGVVPLSVVHGVPQTDAGVTVPIPGYLGRARSPWHTAVPLTGRHVLLEPLDPVHSEALFTALDDPDVWAHIPSPRPTGPEGVAAFIATALADPARLAYVQRDARTGAVIGTTSFYAIDPANRTLEIGYTMLARPVWRTAVNTEAKLLLLSRAFDELGAVRVQWQTDDRNERSQRAIERLGATREGVLRAHKHRGDGTWRDSVIYGMTGAEWPAARARLAARLQAGRPAGQAA